MDCSTVSRYSYLLRVKLIHRSVFLHNDGTELQMSHILVTVIAYIGTLPRSLHVFPHNTAVQLYAVDMHPCHRACLQLNVTAIYLNG